MERIVYLDPMDLELHQCVEVFQSELEDAEVVEELKESIEETGETLEPVRITCDNKVVIGWKRVLACRDLGFKVPCLHVPDDLSDRELVKWCVDENMKRKHLTPQQKLRIAELSEEVLSSMPHRTKARYKNVQHNLIPEWRELFDNGEGTIMGLEEIAMLSGETQKAIYELLQKRQNTSVEQVVELTRAVDENDERIKELKEEVDLWKNTAEQKDKYIKQLKDEYEKMESEVDKRVEEVVEEIGTPSEREQIMMENLEHMRKRIVELLNGKINSIP